MKHLFSMQSLRDIRRRKRLTRYQAMIQNLPESNAPPDQRLEALCRLWQRWHWEDLVTLPGQVTTHHHLVCYHDCITQLVDNLQRVNRMIQDEQDDALEIFIRGLTRERQRHSLEMWVADEDLHAIDEQSWYRRLHGALCVHLNLLRERDTQYYHRWSDAFYRDLQVFSTTLIDAYSEYLSR